MNELLLQEILSANESKGAQRNESSAAYTAYLYYRAMGASRSLRKLVALFSKQSDYKAFQQRHELGSSYFSEPPSRHISTIENWSTTWRWQERIREWERHIEAERLILEQEARLEERERRKMFLDAMAAQLAKTIKSIHPENVGEMKQVFYSFKIYMDESRREHNDLPKEKSKDGVRETEISVSFTTETISEDTVRNHLQTLGLDHLVQEHQE